MLPPELRGVFLVMGFVWLAVCFACHRLYHRARLDEAEKKLTRLIAQDLIPAALRLASSAEVNPPETDIWSEAIEELNMDGI